MQTTASVTPVKLTHNEVLKEADPTLGGTLAQTLANPEADRFSEDDTQFLKFHGIYQQDDRDKRKIAKHYMFMVRTRCPGGVIPWNHFVVVDDICAKYGNNTLRITTRQGFQLHGIVKSGLGPSMKAINEALMTTVAACGDINRNVMASPTPATSPLVDQVLADARKISNALLPKTEAYHQIWVEGQPLNLEEEKNKSFVDPLYGKTYLPRKFKVAFVIPPVNDIDVFTNDLGFVAIIENEQLVGYNLLAGGGLGMSHGNAQTYPRMADVLGFLLPEEIEAAAKAMVTIHRDFGDRTNRKHARLKYVLEERGAEWCRQELEQRAGIKLQPAREMNFTRQGDVYGWHKQLDGRYFLTLFVENGRVKDTETVRLKTALRQIALQFKVEFRLTANQNILIVNLTEQEKEAVTALLLSHGVKVENQASILRLASIACPALPTCGLALSESERVMPDVITRFDQLLEEIGLIGEEIVIRMTGCPNGCARPYMAEIGFVGRAPNKYQLYLGGNESSTRLSKLYKENVLGNNLTEELRPLLVRFKQERQPAERFGDYCTRVLLTAPVAAAQ